MKRALLFLSFSLVIISFSASANWEKIIDCNNASMVIDQECFLTSKGENKCQYQLVLRNKESFTELLANYHIGNMKEIIQKVNLDYAAGYFSNKKTSLSHHIFKVEPKGSGFIVYSSYEDYGTRYPIGNWYYDSCTRKDFSIDYSTNN